jgi:hypothetical protein
MARKRRRRLPPSGFTRTNAPAASTSLWTSRTVPQSRSRACPRWTRSEAARSTAHEGRNQPLRQPMLQPQRHRARCGGASDARRTSRRERSPGGGLCSRRFGARTEPPPGEMRLRTDTAASAASLADYLRRCECLVEVIDRRIIDATARPQSFAAPHHDVELEGYLTVWQAMHPESLVERLTPFTPR